MRKGEATRREIIEKAAPIFNRKGFEGASLSELMQATGLEKGGIYRHFKSKEQLAAEAFDYSWKTAIDQRMAGTETIANSVDRLKRIVWNFQGKRDGLVPGGCPLLNTAIDADDGNGVLRQRARQAMNGLLSRLEALVRDGQRRGEISYKVKAREVSKLVVGTLEGGLMIERLQKTKGPLKLACKHVEEYLEEKVRAKEIGRG
jgi:TetR/AcrR family transcriptional regulator, transcriptional repressor for nem operon